MSSLALSVGCLALSAASVEAQDLSRYRAFQLGMTVAAVTEEARVPATAVRLLHQRPQLMQELDWFPPEQQAGAPEAVRIVRFAFYDNRLYQIAVGYHRQRIEGLTAEDLVEAISGTYGTAILASSGIGSRRAAGLDEDRDRTVFAEWRNAEYSVSLVQTSHPTGFELLLVAPEPEGLAQTARIEARRLDLIDAPQLELSRQRKQGEEDRAKAEKARLANKPVFRF